MSDAALETLRLRAEAAVANAPTTRRPSWAPPLRLPDELVEMLRATNMLKPDGVPVARLWASFHKPHPNAEVVHSCRGFVLALGTKPKGYTLFNVWRSGDQWRGWGAPRETTEEYAAHLASSNERLIANGGTGMPNDMVSGLIEEHARKIQRHALILQLLTDAADSSEAIIIAGAAAACLCCRCYRLLTDPISRQRGIGPECVKFVAERVAA